MLIVCPSRIHLNAAIISQLSIICLLAKHVSAPFLKEASDGRFPGWLGNSRKYIDVSGHVGQLVRMKEAGNPWAASRQYRKNGYLEEEMQLKERMESRRTGQ